MQLEDGMSLASTIFGKDAFKSRQDGKYQRSPNRAVIDIMAYYFADPAVRAAIPDDKKPAIRAAFEDLCDNNAKFCRLSRHQRRQQRLQASGSMTGATH